MFIAHGIRKYPKAPEGRHVYRLWVSYPIPNEALFFEKVLDSVRFC